MSARRSPPKRVGIVLKAYTTGLAKPAAAVAKVLHDAKAEVFVDTTGRKLLPREQAVPLAKMDVDFIVTIGGDGTILRTLQYANAPVFAINAGIMGFLAEAPLAQAGTALRRVLRGHYVVEKRLRILPKLNDKPLVPCLNEVVLHTSQVAKMIHFEVLRDREVIHRVRADGVIAATPTGSTSYNLSVGGPIIDPEVSAFVISPIAPFSLTTRPVVVPSSRAISIRMTDDRPAVLVLDGQGERRFSVRDRLEIARAPHDAQFIRFSSEFYARLHEKHSMKL